MAIVNESCSEAGETRRMKPEELAFWVFTCLMVAICTISGLYEFKWGIKEDSLINTMSVLNHTKRLFTIKKPIKDDGLFALHGIKMFAIFAVYLSHKYFSLVWVSASHILIEESKLSFFGILTGVTFDLSCDSFLFVSGAIVGYTFFKSMKKDMPNLVFLILKRFLRLIPAYYYSIWFYVVALDRFSGGPYWNLFYGYNIKYCKNNWWLNLLLVNNYVKTSEMCLSTSWYVNCDFHFFIAAVLLIMILRKRQTAGFFIMGILLVLTTLSPGISTYIKHYDPFYFSLYDFSKVPRKNAAFIERYMPSHNRAASYIIGMAFGIFMFKEKETKRNISYLGSLLGWVVGTILMLGPSLAGTKFYLEDVGDNDWVFASAVITLRRPLWALGLAVLLYISHHRPLALFKSVCESAFCVVISRLTYCIYLIHFFWLISREREGVSFNHLNPVLEGIGDLVVITVLAGLLYVYLEGPIKLLLDKYILKIGRPKNNISNTAVMVTVQARAKISEHGKTEL